MRWRICRQNPRALGHRDGGAGHAAAPCVRKHRECRHARLSPQDGRLSKRLEDGRRTPARSRPGRSNWIRQTLTEVYDPGNPLADATGHYDGSNVDMVVEIADAREAQRSYEANLKMFDQARQMTHSLLDLSAPIRGGPEWISGPPCRAEHTVRPARPRPRSRSPKRRRQRRFARGGRKISPHTLREWRGDRQGRDDRRRRSACAGRRLWPQTQLAVETAVTVRDKVVEAYQEILRMPV